METTADWISTSGLVRHLKSCAMGYTAGIITRTRFVSDIQEWARDVKARDRYYNETFTCRDQDVGLTRRDRDETFVGHETSPRRKNRPRPTRK